MEQKKNVNVEELAREISNVLGENVEEKNIHMSLGRPPYIQAPEDGAPMLMRHYRGPVFVDMSIHDYEKISNGDVDAHKYVQSANWLIGFYAGGGSITGAYYQPWKLIEGGHDVGRYLEIWRCRMLLRASGHVPEEEECNKCKLKKCPLSEFKEGIWEDEVINEAYDPRVELFKALKIWLEERAKAKQYDLRGFFWRGDIADNDIIMSPNGHYSEREPFSFSVTFSEALIRSLMMRDVVPNNWNEYIEQFNIKIRKETYLEVNEENLIKAFEGLDYTMKNNINTTVAEENNDEQQRNGCNLIAKIFRRWLN